MVARVKSMDDRLKELLEISQESKKLLQQMHQARKDLLQLDKDLKHRIESLITSEVNRQISEIRNETREKLDSAVDEIIQNVTTALNERLKI